MHCEAGQAPKHQAQNEFSHLVPENLLELLGKSAITMLPTVRELTPEMLNGQFPSGPIFVCDAYVSGVESGIERSYGYELGRIVNIDHHAPTPHMSRKISSGNLALEYVRQHGPVPLEVPVVIHHLDCDSFASCLILRGILPPAPEWGEIVIAADHTGAEHPIADLLQGLSETKDFGLSAENLLRLVRGRELESEAYAALADRIEQRAIAKSLIESGQLKRAGGLTWFITEKNIDGELLVPLIPDAAVIMLATPFREKSGYWVNRLRLGLAAPDGLSLLDLGVGQFDKAWGGRWNAGSNNRGGGSALDPHDYASRLEAVINKRLLN